MNNVIGITGGIGSGKSMIARIFGLLGVPVYDADTEAKKITETHSEVRQAIIALLGKNAYLPNQTYNKAWIAAQVFGNEDLLLSLNTIIHPAVRRHSLCWVQNQTAPYLLYEAALLNQEHKNSGFLSKIIVVTAPENLRIKRILARDTQRSVQEIKNIMNRQMPDSERAFFADYIIENNEINLLIPQILVLHREFLTYFHAEKHIDFELKL